MKYYTMQNIITLLGVTKNTIINWEKSGKIPMPKRDDIFGHRYWTDADLEIMRELSKEIKGRVFETYRKQKILVYAPKEGRWKYQVIVHLPVPSGIIGKMRMSLDAFASKEKALNKAKECVDRMLKKYAGE
ncbi:MAG: hypothetical protein A3K16_03285 [Omnitrophica bacterium RIFCSPLOWO2_01_FULL_45_24]|nr:MAG: hypothetical protein A3K16_03285 [Omnitrophica bacterium RIFCSPLOWO2_01_FULL_45_24]